MLHIILRYPKNIVVILFNGKHPWTFDNQLICKSSAFINPNNQITDSSHNKLTHFEDYANISLAFMPIPLCNWTTFIAICKVTENIQILSLKSKIKSLNTVTVRFNFKNIQ